MVAIDEWTSDKKLSIERKEIIITKTIKNENKCSKGKQSKMK